MKVSAMKCMIAVGLLTLLGVVQGSGSTGGTVSSVRKDVESGGNAVDGDEVSVIDTQDITNGGDVNRSGDGMELSRAYDDRVGTTEDVGTEDEDESGKEDVEIEESPEATPELDDGSGAAGEQDAADAFDEKEKTDFDVDTLLSGSEGVGELDREDIEVDEGEDSSESEEVEAESDMQTVTHKKKGPKHVGKVRKVTLVVASKTSVQVWRNFKLVGRAKSWRTAEEMVFKARVGDSITILSSGWKSFYGVAAMVRPGGKRWYVTGGRGRRAFKAIGLKALRRMKKADLRSPRRKMCFLRYPYAVKEQRGKRFAKGGKASLLFKKRAKYVWARGSTADQVIGVRFVVGGDRCGKPTPRPTPGGARCACRVVRTGSKGDCLEFHNRRFSGIPNKVGACRPRKCGLKYECMQPGRRSKILCVRRFARFEVRPVGPLSKGRCKNVPLRPAQPYYAPYS